jgi:hypothetical protein
MSNDPRQLPPDQPTRPLEYRSPAHDARRISGWQVAGGLVLSIAVGMTAVFFGLLASLGRNLQTSRENAGAMIAIIGGAVLLINVSAFFAFRNPRLRGLAIGLWIGFGVTVLIEGACFGLGR